MSTIDIGDRQFPAIIHVKRGNELRRYVPERTCYPVFENDSIWSGDGDEALMRAIRDEARQKLDEIKERGNQQQELLNEFGRMRSSTEHEQDLYEDMLKKISVDIESYNKDVEEAMEEEMR